MLDYIIIETNNIDIKTLHTLYDIYSIYAEDCTRDDYLIEIINGCFTHIILYQDNNDIIGYTNIKYDKTFINQNILLLIISDSVLLEKYIGNSNISYSITLFYNTIINNNFKEKIYMFWSSNTIYTFLYISNLITYYPNINNTIHPENLNYIINYCGLGLSNKYNNFCIPYSCGDGKIKHKYIDFRNFLNKINLKYVDLFLKYNPNYINGDCICLFAELTLQDINNIQYKYNSKL